MSTLGSSLALMAYALLPQVSQASAPGEASGVDVLAVQTDRARRMTVPVRLGDRGPFLFLIDTGAQNTVISDVLAQRMALIPNAKATVVGVAGSQLVDTVEIEEIVMGRRSFYGLVAPVLDSSHIGADGIVGIDGLQGQRVMLDFRRNVMLIDDARGAGDDRGFEIVVTARRRSGQLIMTNALIDGVRVDVVIDTGAETSIGNRALQRALSRRSTSAPEELTSVTGQTIMADIGFGSRLELGGVTFTNVKLAYADSPAFPALDLDRKPAVLLGMAQLRLFNRVAIDFGSRKVLFDAAW